MHAMMHMNSTETGTEREIVNSQYPLQEDCWIVMNCNELYDEVWLIVRGQKCYFLNYT